MAESLDVYFWGYRAATLTRLAAEDYLLEYDRAWADSDTTIPLSLSLPLTPRRHSGRRVVNLIDNLLPDNPDVRQRWATDAGLDTVEPFYLLAEYGQDIAGAASFVRSGRPPVTQRRPIDDSEIAERIAQVREDETTWHDPNLIPEGQFSLGGAQSKFSLARYGDEWFQTTGEDPSTHLFKPSVRGAVDGELTEFVTMRAALALGIPTAVVEMYESGGQHSLVVERFDRVTTGSSATRLHQEDVLQALGLARLRKYEENDGPGVDRISALLSERTGSASLSRYATMLVYHWILLSTDAHAKNFSLFIDPDGAQLAPLYDASSAIPYLGASLDLDQESVLARAANIALSTRYGASYRAGDIGRFEIEVVARRCRLDVIDLLTTCAVLVAGLPSAIEDAAAALPPSLQTDTVARFVEWMPLRAAQAARAVGI